MCQLPVVPFSVQNLPFTEPMLTVWAQLVNLAGSKLEKQRMKKSLSRGLAGTEHAHACVLSSLCTFVFGLTLSLSYVHVLKMFSSTVLLIIFL